VDFTCSRVDQKTGVDSQLVCQGHWPKVIGLN
jgi:hypothetical protein